MPSTNGQQQRFQPIVAANSCPDQAQTEPQAEQQQEIPPLNERAQGDFCARLAQARRMLIAIGEQLLADKSLRVETVHSLISAIYAAEPGDKGTDWMPGEMAELLSDALPTIDLSGVIQSWQGVVANVTGADIGVVLPLLACRHVLECLANYAVGWGTDRAISKGRASGIGVSI